MLHDFAARGLAVQNRCIARRLTTVDTLMRSIAENLPKGLPGLIDVPIDEARNSATQIASGKDYGFSSSAPASNLHHHYGLFGANWSPLSTVYVQAMQGLSGNGSDPATTPSLGASATVRFATFVDKFEVRAINYFGFRARVNGKYLQTGLYGVASLNGDTQSGRYFMFDFSGTEFAGTGLKLVELQGHFDLRFGGVRVPTAYTVASWPQALPIKAALHGDSMPNTLVDSADYRLALHGLMPHVMQMLTGIPDITVNSQGGCGFYADNTGTRSDFVEHAGVNYAAGGFDLLWETGGKNDGVGMYGTQAAYQAKVEEWLEIVLGGNPDAIVILTGPITSSSSESYANAVSIRERQNAKKAAAARFPQNCAFIETCGNAVTDDPWVNGTGKVGAAAGNGNADLVIGTDGVHPSIFGHQCLGTRLVGETARVLPLLASRIRNGVVAGVNDADLA